MQAAEEAWQDQSGEAQRVAANAYLPVGCAAERKLTLTLLLRESPMVRGAQGHQRGHQRSRSTRQCATKRRRTSSQRRLFCCTARQRRKR